MRAAAQESSRQIARESTRGRVLQGHVAQAGAHAAHDAGADENHEQGKAHRLGECHPQVPPANPAPAGNATDHGQQDHAQDVVEHGRPHDDAGKPGVEHVQVGKHAGGNGHASGYHGGGHKHGFVAGFAAQAHVEEAEHKGSNHPSHRHAQCLPAYAHQILRPGFQAGGKKHEDGANFGEGVNIFAGSDEAGGMGPENHSGQDFAQHGGQRKALEQLAKNLRPDKNGEQLQQQRVSATWHKRKKQTTGGALIF